MRHGNTFEAGQTPLQVGARTDLPLTSYGLLQAEQMVKYLMAKKISPKAIYAGSLKRQTQSAEIIAQSFGLRLEEAPALNEIDYGLWEGLPSEEIGLKWAKEYREWNEEGKWQSHIFKGSYQNHFNALIGWLERLKEIHEGETVFAVTSNGLLRLFKNEKVKTGHFCELLLDQGEIHLSQWNQKPH